MPQFHRMQMNDCGLLDLQNLNVIEIGIVLAQIIILNLVAGDVIESTVIGILKMMTRIAWIELLDILREVQVFEGLPVTKRRMILWILKTLWLTVYTAPTHIILVEGFLSTATVQKPIGMATQIIHQEIGIEVIDTAIGVEGESYGAYYGVILQNLTAICTGLGLQLILCNVVPLCCVD